MFFSAAFSTASQHDIYNDLAKITHFYTLAIWETNKFKRVLLVVLHTSVDPTGMTYVMKNATYQIIEYLHPPLSVKTTDHVKCYNFKCISKFLTQFTKVKCSLHP